MQALAILCVALGGISAACTEETHKGAREEVLDELEVSNALQTIRESDFADVPQEERLVLNLTDGPFAFEGLDRANMAKVDLLTSDGSVHPLEHVVIRRLR